MHHFDFNELEEHPCVYPQWFVARAGGRGSDGRSCEKRGRLSETRLHEFFDRRRGMEASRFTRLPRKEGVGRQQLTPTWISFGPNNVATVQIFTRDCITSLGLL
eukprot:8315192-Pyramimonas_sp.AAC.1